MNKILIGAAIGVLAATSASAADLAVKAPVASPPPPIWTGFYAGLHAGWAWDALSATTTSVNTDLLGLPTSHSLDRNGPVYGGQAGYNVQLANWVVGIEGDFSGVHVTGTSSVNVIPNVNPLLPRGTAAISSELEWLASIRGRLGVTWRASLLYITGGYAAASVSHKSTYEVITPFVAAASLSTQSTLNGWVIGGGVESMLTGNWTIRAEYLYYRFGGLTASTNLAHNINIPPFPASLRYDWSDLDAQVVRFGFNYKL